MDMTRYLFYWNDGRCDVLDGTNAVDALKSAGYTALDIIDLAFFTRGRGKEYCWNKKTKKWEWLGYDPLGGDSS